MIGSMKKDERLLQMWELSNAHKDRAVMQDRKERS